MCIRCCGIKATLSSALYDFLHRHDYNYTESGSTYRTTVVPLMRYAVTDALIHQELRKEDRVCDISLKCVIALNGEHFSIDLSNEGCWNNVEEMVRVQSHLPAQDLLCFFLPFSRESQALE